MDKRQPAKDVPLYAHDITPEEGMQNEQPAESVVIYRQKGTGRPTKKERAAGPSLILIYRVISRGVFPQEPVSMVNRGRNKDTAFSGRFTVSLDRTVKDPSSSI